MLKIFGFMHNFIKLALIKLLVFYKRSISPYLPHACRYQPTCSEYMMQAIEVYGIFKGLYLGLKRLFRCHPWGGSGYDPVPPRKGTPLHKDKD